MSAEDQKHHVWLDVDTGTDDAHAIMLTLRSPELHICGISCVVGNADVDTVLASTLRVCDAAGARSDLPIARGCERPLVEPTHFCFEIHGDDSLGDLNPPLPPSTRAVSELHAVELLLETLKSSTKKITIFALAPLTNIAKAIRADQATMLEKVERIVWMGGSVTAGGNATSWAEANAFYDPEAAHIVLSAGIPILMYTWDVYLKVDISKQDLRTMGLHDENTLIHTDDDYKDNENKEGHFLDGASKLGARLLHRDMRHFEMTSAQIGDAGAIAALIMPSALETRFLHVAVELTGEHTRGMTVCDLRGMVCEPDRPMMKKNVHVCMNVDGPRIAALYISRVLRPPADSPFAAVADLLSAHSSQQPLESPKPFQPDPSSNYFSVPDELARARKDEEKNTPPSRPNNNDGLFEGGAFRTGLQLSLAAVAAWAYRSFGGGMLAWISRRASGRLTNE